MDLGSPDKFSLDSSNLLKDDDFTVGKLDLNLAVSKEGGEGYGHESEECGDRTQVDLNHQHHVSSSMHAVVRNEKLESHSGRNDATEIMSVRYSDKSSSPVEAVNFHNDLEMGDPDCLPLRLPQEVDSNNQLEDMKEKSHCHEILIKSPDKSSGNLHHEKTESDCMVMEQEGTVHLMEKEYGGNEALIEDKYYSGKLIGGNEEMEGRNAYLHGQERTPIRSASPVRDISSSPESVPNLHGKLPSSSRGCHDSPNSLKTSRRKISPSPEIVDGNSRRVLSEDHQSPSTRHMSPPSRRSGRESPRRDESLWKRLSSSPRRHQLSPDSRISDRSVSRSPPRSDSFYGSRRDHRDRLRSRSPYARSRHRRSPRRLSPRRRSPQGYHSRRRSPRRPWSPPHNRNNGVGRPGNNLFIAGFSFVTTERDLERKFSRFGRVRDVRIVRDKRSGDSRGFGFLSLERDEEADAAIRALDQTEWNGRVVLVEKSKSR